MTVKRQIKFRGKTTANGHWVYGSLIDYGGNDFAIRNNKSNPWVTADSVGQFTGLLDNFDDEIYEGDIVRISIRPTKENMEATERNAELAGVSLPSWIYGGDIIARVSYFDGAFHFVHLKSYLPGENNAQEPMFHYLFHERHPEVKPSFIQTIEIIGNIHDNPELLQVKKTT